MADTVQAAPAPAPSNPKKKRKRSKGSKTVMAIAAIVLVLCLAAIGYIIYGYWAGQNDYDSIAEQAFEEPGPQFSLADLRPDWDLLRSINPDVVGWIYMPDTPINYPIAHKDGDDDYYLHHNFSNGRPGPFAAEYGSVMLSGVNNADFSDQVNVLYSHNMRNGSMFAFINRMTDPEVFNTHRTAYLLTPAANYRLESFALDHVHKSDAAIVQPVFSTDEGFWAYLQERIDTSLVTAVDPAAPPVQDIPKAFALTTCDGADNTNRYLVFCYAAEYIAFDEAGNPIGDGSGIADGDVVVLSGAITERVA